MPRKSAKASFDLTRHIQGAAAIDIGSRMHMAAVSPEAAKDPIRSFGTFTSDLHALAEWFKDCKVTTACRQLSRMMIEANCTAARNVDFSLS